MNKELRELIHDLSLDFSLTVEELAEKLAVQLSDMNIREALILMKALERMMK